MRHPMSITRVFRWFPQLKGQAEASTSTDGR